MQKNRQVFDIVMQLFLAKVKNGPVFVCSCCERLLFESQALLIRPASEKHIYTHVLMTVKYPMFGLKLGEGSLGSAATVITNLREV